MLSLICYLLAVVLLGLAAILPDTMPYRDRLAYAGLALFATPWLAHALDAHS
jgi:hypothetical protein